MAFKPSAGLALVALAIMLVIGTGDWSSAHTIAEIIGWIILSILGIVELAGWFQG